MEFMIGALIVNILFLFYNLWYNKRVTKLLETCEDIIKLHEEVN